ncbi:MAG TPA: LPS-assembly protein LptD [Firmicutes bacterium]|nr:LPS-assembly protein LptD [Bacillota bacterium]
MEEGRSGASNNIEGTVKWGGKMRSVVVLAVMVVIVVFGAAVQGSGASPQPITIEAQNFEYEADGMVVIATGSVRATRGDFVLTADHVEADLRSETIVATGNVKIRRGSYEAQGDTLHYDFKRDLSEIGGASGKVGEALVKGRTLRAEPGKLTLDDGQVTKCNLPEPCWHIGMRRVVIYPGEKIVADGAVLWIGRHQVVPFPRLVLPLRRKGDTETVLWGEDMPVPRAGYNKDDGFFVGVTYKYPTLDDGKMTYDVAYLSKKGYQGSVSYKRDMGQNLDLKLSLVHQTWKGTGGGVELDASLPGYSIEARLKREFTSDGTLDSIPSLRLRVAPVAVGGLNLTLSGTAGFGQFWEEVTGSRGTRVDFSVLLREREPVNLGHGFQGHFSAGLGDSRYSTGDVMRTVDATVGVARPFKMGSIGVGYHRLWVTGKTPFEFDAVEGVDEITGNATLRVGAGPNPWDKWELGVSANYDLAAGDFSDVDWTLTRHMHCFEVSARWREKREEFGLDIRLIR